MTFTLQPTLAGALVRLRPLVEGDREALFGVASDPLIWEQHPYRERYQRAVFDVFFDDAMEKGALLISDAASGAVIGSTRYYDWDAAGKSVAIGFTFLSRACWGAGYNRETKGLMLDYAFRHAETVLFHVGENNLRSRRAVVKLGAVFVRTEVRQLLDGRSSPSAIYRIDRALYGAKQAASAA